MNTLQVFLLMNRMGRNIPILETRTEKEMEYNIISNDEITLLLKNIDGKNLRVRMGIILVSLKN